MSQEEKSTKEELCADFTQNAYVLNVENYYRDLLAFYHYAAALLELPAEYNSYVKNLLYSQSWAFNGRHLAHNLPSIQKPLIERCVHTVVPHKELVALVQDIRRVLKEVETIYKMTHKHVAFQERNNLP